MGENGGRCVGIEELGVISAALNVTTLPRIDHDEKSYSADSDTNHSNSSSNSSSNTDPDNAIDSLLPSSTNIISPCMFCIQPPHPLLPPSLSSCSPPPREKCAEYLGLNATHSHNAETKGADGLGKMREGGRSGEGKGTQGGEAGGRFGLSVVGREEGGILRLIRACWGLDVGEGL